MRVLHIGKYFPPCPGGIEYFLADLMAALPQQGVQGAALVHAPHPRGADPEWRDGSPIYRVPSYGRLLYAPLSPAFPRWLARVLDEFRPDLLHLHLPNTSAFWALLLPAARRLPWVVHWHSDVVPSQLRTALRAAYRAYRPLEQALLRHSRRIIVTSPPYLQSSAALQPWRERCAVIPLGLAPDRIRAPAAASAGLWRGAGLRLLAVGRLTYYKGHEILLQALARLPDAELIIVGDGEFRPRLQALLTRLNLGERAQLLGQTDDARLQALFASCDALCLPSLERTEAFGLVQLEAMCFGKPVIASDIPGSGVGWVVRQAGHGVLVPPGDVAALSAALAALAVDVATRERLGQQGWLRFQELFHIERVAAQVADLYRGLLAAPG